MIKRVSNLLLQTDEEDENAYLNNLNIILSLIESHSNLINLYDWCHISAKFYDHLKQTKARKNSIVVFC